MKYVRNYTLCGKYELVNCKLHNELLLWRRNGVSAGECLSAGMGQRLCEHGMIHVGVTGFVQVQWVV